MEQGSKEDGSPVASRKVGVTQGGNWTVSPFSLKTDDLS